MTKSITLLADTLRSVSRGLTVAELATATGLSASRVRELAPEVEGVVIDRTVKPMTFSIPARAAEAAPEGKAKPTRKLLNPQPVIAKKTAALKAAGGDLVYASRTWSVMSGSTVVKTLTSAEFAALSAEELVALLP